MFQQVVTFNRLISFIHFLAFTFKLLDFNYLYSDNEIVNISKIKFILIVLHILLYLNIKYQDALLRNHIFIIHVKLSDGKDF